MTFFNGSSVSGWTRTFRLDYIELPRVSLNDCNHNVREKFDFKQVIMLDEYNCS